MNATAPTAMGWQFNNTYLNVLQFAEQIIMQIDPVWWQCSLQQEREVNRFNQRMYRLADITIVHNNSKGKTRDRNQYNSIFVTFLNWSQCHAPEKKKLT